MSTTYSPEEQIVLGQTVAEKLALSMMDDIDEAITQAVLLGMIPLEIAPVVKRQVWMELAIQASERVKAHGD